VSTSGVIEVRDLVTKFGEHIVHDGISFTIEPGQVVALIGGSGCGKSTLLRELIRLQQPSGGELLLFGEDVWRISEEKMNSLRRRFGVLFQNGALFSSLSVGENVAAPMIEQGNLSDKSVERLVKLRLALAGLSAGVSYKRPGELSGGMRKRVALARAMALEPEILFLDEPTSGLDSINARAFDKLIRTLADSLGLTVFMVTHDLDSLAGIADRIIVLGDGKVIADGAYEEVLSSPEPWINEYFSSRVA